MALLSLKHFTYCVILTITSVNLLELQRQLTGVTTNSLIEIKNINMGTPLKIQILKSVFFCMLEGTKK